ncbi:MAG: hypothetical protein DSZ01_03190, partial [Gammaproteobacteria bacterium]
LSVRVNRKNQNHHLWNNNGKWWCHLTVHKPDYTSERHRVPLHTRNVSAARQRRDKLFAEWAGEVCRMTMAILATIFPQPVEVQSGSPYNG